MVMLAMVFSHGNMVMGRHCGTIAWAIQLYMFTQSVPWMSCLYHASMPNKVVAKRMQVRMQNLLTALVITIHNTR